MKSKKGKLRGLSPCGRESRENVLSGLGARVTCWTFRPRGPPAGTAADLFVEAASEMAVVFPLDTTRGAVAEGRTAPRCWHIVKKHAHRLVCATPKFHCSADTPCSVETPRGFSRVRAG